MITGKFLGKFIVKWILKLPPRLAYVATLPCETLVTAKQAINDILQGSVAIFQVRWINKKGLLLSVKKFKIGEYLEKLQTRALSSKPVDCRRSMGQTDGRSTVS